MTAQDAPIRQLHALLVDTLRQLLPPSPLTPALHQPIQPPPPTFQTVPPSPERFSSVSSNPRPSRPSPHVFPSQSSAPPTGSPRYVPSPCTPTQSLSAPRHYPPPPIEAFPRAPQSPFVPLTSSSNTACTSQGCTSQSPAPQVPVSRRVPPPEPASSASRRQFQPPPTASHAFPTELQAIQSDLSHVVTSRPASARQPSAPLIFSPREVPPPASSALASAQPVQPPPPSLQVFPHTLQFPIDVPPRSVLAPCARTSQLHAPLVCSSRNNSQPAPRTQASRRPAQQSPPPSSSPPHVRQPPCATPSDLAPVMGAQTLKQCAPFTCPPRDHAQSSPSTVTPHQSSQVPPRPINVFPPGLQPTRVIPPEVAAVQSVSANQQPAPFVNAPRTLSLPTPSTLASGEPLQLPHRSAAAARRDAPRPPRATRRDGSGRPRRSVRASRAGSAP